MSAIEEGARCELVYTSWQWIEMMSFNVSLFSRVLRDSTPRFVRPLVGHTLLLLCFLFFDRTTPAQCSGDLKYGPCPPTRDWGSCVYGLVFTSVWFKLC